MLTRRGVLSSAGALAAAAGSNALATRMGSAAAPYLGPADLPEGALSSATLDALPGKAPLIKRSYRPPNYETPINVFNESFTPNDQFFVRWHLANIPEVDGKSWKLKVGGEGAATAFELTLDQIGKDFEQVEISAVCQCSGNRRGLSKPHVMGVEWGYGAMGNAKWCGARLKDILTKAGIKKDAVEVAFDGADSGVIEKTPDFIKSLPAWKAVDENTLVAIHMNGKPLPHWNGYPARIVVPGWTATYWVKQLTDVNVLMKPFAGFWMNPAYRIPVNKFPIVERFISQETAANTPITEMLVNSLITNLLDGHQTQVGKPVEVKGIAWDGGFEITQVDISIDGGKLWNQAALGSDLGRFSWRQWTSQFVPRQPGRYAVMARATNSRGATQTAELIFNPAGYHNNVIQKITIEAV